MIHIVDYQMGNLRSVQKAFERIGIHAKITATPDEVMRAGKLILPGVGHFSRAMDILHSTGLADALNQAVMVRKTPILGICLGMQLMTEFSEEGDVEGFGWIKGRTSKFCFADSFLKIPHMGWNQLSFKKQSRLMQDVSTEAYYYFVHSYFVACEDPDTVLAETKYGNTFVSAFEKDHVYGCQFHPEKSHDAGLKIIENFVAL
jgi:imidazole glycerol-phosphate synthase subunit HisH